MNTYPVCTLRRALAGLLLCAAVGVAAADSGTAFTRVRFISRRGDAVVYDLGAPDEARKPQASRPLPSQRARGTINELPGVYALTRQRQVFIAGNYHDSLGVSRPVSIRNDGQPRVALVRDANLRMYQGGRSTLAPCLVLAIISAVAAPIPFLLPQQNESTQLSGTVLSASAGAFSVAAVLGGVFTRRGRARIAVRRDHPDSRQTRFAVKSTDK